MKKSEILAYADKQGIMTFGTLCERNNPMMRAVINIRNKDVAPHLAEFFKKDQRFFIITNTSTAKVAHIRANSASSLYMYDGKNYSGLLLVGKTGEVNDKKVKHALWDDSWKMYYPDGVDSVDFALLEFTPQYYIYNADHKTDEGAIKW